MDTQEHIADMTVCNTWFEAADGYSIKPPLPQKVYKQTLFAPQPETLQ